MLLKTLNFQILLTPLNLQKWSTIPHLLLVDSAEASILQHCRYPPQNLPLSPSWILG